MRFAICNETFDGWDHARVCRLVAQLGYQGLELAPYTLAPLITEVSGQTRLTLRKQAEDNGLVLLGLHWLLAKTEGFHITAPDASVRHATAQYLADLARCCRDLGGDVLVLGSPAQRRIPSGYTLAQASDFAVDTLGCRALPAIADAGVTLCLEPLTTQVTDFLTTCEEGDKLVDRLAHPACMLHLDVKAMSSESFPIPELIRRHASRIGHFHANDPNKRGPGFGKTDFVPIFQALHDIRYGGWVSVEMFDYSPDPETIARESLHYMRACADKVDGTAR